MKLSTRADIEAPLAHVFAVLSDYEHWETAAMRRGADVVRVDALRVPGVGMAWRTQFDYRGKPRKLDVKLTGLEAPHRLAFSGNSVSLNSVVTLELMELSARRTRVIVATEVKPRTLGARLVLQSLKLAKARLTHRFEERVARIAVDIEARYRANPKV
ncbi:MAG: SRPBCC family protein [Paracoccaceae bacterium]|nr:SRPBCC family protein [Paracoccaceae bacterium]